MQIRIFLVFYFIPSKNLGTYLGQNFLIDSKIKHRIAEKVKQMYTELQAEQLIEIWPGKGAITKLIKDISKDFIVIEKDATMQQGLEEILQGTGKIIIDDVLDVNMNVDMNVDSRDAPLARPNPEGVIRPNPAKAFITWNLPYYITSPILRKFFTPPKSPLGGLFMVQAEVGEKIKTDAKKKSYLYRLLNYAYQIDYLKTIPAKAFTPPPKVKSCLISLVKKSDLPPIPFDKLVNFLDAFSPYSRKTLGKISKMLNKKETDGSNRGRSHWTPWEWMSYWTPWQGGSPDGCRGGGLSGGLCGCSFLIPESLTKKRLEELSRNEIALILKSTT